MAAETAVLILPPGAAGEPVSLDLSHGPAVSPRISCIMATRGHAHPGRCAIECFRAQGYENRELVIACATNGSEVEKLVGKLGDSRIVFLGGVAGGSVGELRNAAIARASGDLLCVWDDDDLSHPDRLTLQFNALHATEAKASFLSRVILWWPARQRIAVSGVRIWENTMLVARDALTPYSARRRGSDTLVGKALRATTRLALVDRPECYCYIAHGSNLWGAEHFELLFANATEVYEGVDYASGLERLTADLPVQAYQLGPARS